MLELRTNTRTERPHIYAVADSFTGVASGAKLDAYGEPLVCAAAMLQINSLANHGGNMDTLNWQSRLFGSFHPGGCMFAIADGSTRLISENLDLATFQQLAVRNDKLPEEGLPK